MTASLRLAVFLAGILLTTVIFWILKKGRIPTKFAIVWLIPTFIILLVAIWPGLLLSVANLMGFKTISNFTIGLLIILILFLIMSLTIIISGQQKKITLLIEEISIMKNEIEKLEDKK